MESLVARSLLQASNATLTYYCPSMDTAANDAGYQYWYQNISNSNMDQAVCCTEAHAAWLTSPGSEMEGDVAQAFQWLALAMCLVAMGFYAYHSWKATTGWEEVYVAVVELIKVCLELTHQFESPATLYLSTGNFVMWIRYAEWLLTCPVILIHLSNITGLQDSYSKRTMMLLVSDLGTITMGITSAACYAWPKWIFFFMGLCYGCNTYFHAAKVYVESYHIVPKGVCRNLVRGMAWCFYVSWTMFPLLFVFGPEGFGIMNRYGSEIGHTIADIISKQTWGLLGHFLRVKIHEHIIIHGNITKPTKLKVAGMEIEAEEMVDHDDPEGVNQGTKQLANRESFIIMRNRMKQQGVDVRASFDEHDMGKAAVEAAMAAGKAAPAAMSDNPMAAMMGTLAAGRVILAVPDISMVDFFRQQFAALPAPIELVPALGVENTIALVQQAMQMGGLDCVLAHPEFLRDRSATGLVNRLHSGGQRIVAFGWSPMGPMRELIESSGADAWLEGPSFGTSINQQQLIATLVRAQQARRQQQQMMMMGGMGMGMGMNAGAPPAAMMGSNMNNSMVGMGGSASPLINNGMMSSNAAGNMMMGNMGGGMGGGMGGVSGGGGMSPGGMGTPTGMQTPNGGMGGMSGGGGAVQMSQMGGMMGAPAPGAATLVGTNPLYNQAPQPSPGSVTPTRPAAGSAAPGGAANEAEMLQQLMAEINRLKGELGEH